VDLIVSDFLAGALLSWALPIALLAAICVWWAVLIRRTG
jgi:hypothetical protein